MTSSERLATGAGGSRAYVSPGPDASFMARLQANWPLLGRDRELLVIESLLDDRRSRAAFLFGPAGVGKTRLATEVRTRAEARATKTFRIVGSATTSGVPFAAVAHLLDAQLLRESVGTAVLEGTNEAALLVGALRTSLRSHNNDDPIVFVDDAHLLDSLSATVVAALIANGDARVVATIRLGEPIHDTLAAVLRSGEAARFDVNELADHEIDTVLRSVLGAPVDPNANSRLQSLAAGNMLYLRELVIGAVDSGSLRLSHGTWYAGDPIAVSPRLHDLLTARLASLSPPDQRAVALLSVGGRVPLHVLESLAADADLTRLEELGIISISDRSVSDPLRPIRSRTDVTFAHPLFGEALLSRLSKLRLRAARVELANALEAASDNDPLGQDPQDLLRVAVLRLDAGTQGDSQTLERGARLARYAHDFALTSRLAEAAFVHHPTPTLGVLLGEALYETGRFEEAERVLRGSLSMTADEREMVQIGGQLLTVLFWGLANDDAAAEVVGHLSDRLTIPECVGALLAHRASLATFSGDPAQGLALLDFLPPLDDPVAFSQIAVNRSMTLSLVGRTGEGLAEADRALELYAQFAEPLLLPHPSIHDANAAFALLHSGAPEQALTRAATGYDKAIADRMVVSLVWCQLVAGESCLLLGRATEALHHFEIALHDATRELFRGQVAMAWAGVALAKARLGDLSGAKSAMQRSDAEVSRIGSFELSICAARAGVLAASGSLGSACSELQRGAAFAASGGSVIGEAWMLHELVRLGMFADAAPRLKTLAMESDNPLVQLRAGHASALVADDADSLVEIAERFYELGALIISSEVFLEASARFRSAGDNRRANASSLRASAALTGTDMTVLPNASGTSTPTPLTPREREIAYLAAEGQTNRDISALLFVSTRTVENHLSKVFVKLGITSRHELSGALGGKMDHS